MTDAGTATFAILPEALLFSDLTPHAKVIYAALVRHGTEPSDCFPSYRRLGELVRCSASTAKRAAVELEKAGWIERVARKTAAGDADSNGFRVHSSPQGVRSPVTPPPTTDESTSGQERPDGPVSDDPTVRSPVTGKREPLNESNGTRRAAASRPAQPRRRTNGSKAFMAYPPDFEAWWSVYPRKEAKGDAAKAYKTALGHATQTQLLDGLRRSVAAWQRERRPPDKVPYPATWLNGRRWDDEYNDRPADTRPAYTTGDPSLTAASARGGSQWA